MRATPDKLLLVDDNEFNRDFLARRLERQGYAVTTTWNGKDALELLAVQRFDIVLLDIEIPVFSGLDVLREIRKFHKPIELPIIVITAHQESQMIVRAFDVGASDYVTKPVDFAVVNARIRMQLALKHAEEANRESEERYSLAVAGSNDGIWDWNLLTNNTFFSDRWKSMLGYQANEIGSTPDEWFARIHPEDRETVEAAISAHLDGRDAHFENEHRVLHRDGSYRWVLSRAVAVRDAAGKAYRIAGSQTDVTIAKGTDPLTGLPNRALFLDRLGSLLDRAKRQDGMTFAVLFLDMDGFKEVNDSLGHLAGDQLLIAFAQRLQHCIRAGDPMSRLQSGHTVARLGGDEFTIVLDELSAPTDALRIAERLMQAMKDPFQIGGHELHMGVSIGVALGSSDTESPKDLLAKADTAMYYAKTHGRCRIAVFTPEMRASAVARIQLEHDLRRGIENCEFTNWYQVIVNLETGKIAGVEALVRWNHPTRGIVQPDEFVPIAEETGLIMAIGTSVLIQACRDVVSLQQSCQLDDTFTVSVNLSCTQFGQRELVEQVRQVLTETGLAPCCLKLEITESMVMTEPQSAGDTLRKLKGLGVKLEIDDFGTGYSSLGYLANYPVDALKVDRSFVSGMERNLKKCEITRTIIGLAHNLGLEVVAEGIETQEQSTLLRLMGCEYGQGYYVSEPREISAVAAFIAGRTRTVALPA